MNDDERDEPPDRVGVLLLEDFCSSTGLDEATVQGLAASGRIAWSVRREDDGTLVGFVDDRLPSADELRALGLTVSDDYDPDAPVVRDLTDRCTNDRLCNGRDAARELVSSEAQNYWLTANSGIASGGNRFSAAR